MDRKADEMHNIRIIDKVEVVALRFSWEVCMAMLSEGISYQRSQSTVTEQEAVSSRLSLQTNK